MSPDRVVARALAAPWRHRATAAQLRQARAVLDALRRDGWVLARLARVDDDRAPAFTNPPCGASRAIVAQDMTHQASKGNL